jgi:hypothetical protein
MSLIAHSRWAAFLLQRCFGHCQNMLRMILSARFACTVAKEALPQELVELVAYRLKVSGNYSIQHEVTD